MTEEEFYKKVDGECHEDLIVFIRQKYKSEKEWEYTNQLYLAEGIGFVWQVDWHEGQEDVEILGYIPVREVEPVKHAKWIWDKSRFMYVCSNCDESATRFTGCELNRAVLSRYYHYCRNCGAKMDLEE